MNEPTTTDPGSRSWRWRHWAAAAVALVLFFLASGDHVARSMDPMWFNDDVRQQVWPFLRIHNPDLFQGDEVAEYYLQCLPVGHQAIYRLTALWVDPRVTSKILPYLTFSAMLLGVWLACLGISGRCAAWLGVCVSVAAGIFLEGMSGGLPRSFAFALVALGAAALVHRRPVWLAVIAVAGAAFYPAVGALLGVALAFSTVIWPGLRSRSDVRLKPIFGVALTAATALGCLAAVALPASGSAAWGNRIGIDDFGEYPEAGFAGRSASIRPMQRSESYLGAVKRTIGFTLRSAGVPRSVNRPAMWVVFLGAIGGGIFLAATNTSSRGLLVLVGVSAMGYHAAGWFFPILYWPSRYVMHVTPVIVVIILTAAGAEIVRRVSSGHRRGILGTTVVTIVVIASLVPLAAAEKTRGLNVSVHDRADFFDFVSSLPVDSIIAGWPVGRLASIRYCSARVVLVDFENHLPFHSHFIEMMRPRAMLSIEATLSTEIDALRRLHEDFGVTHFVHTPRFAEQRPFYFEPFNSLIAELLRNRGNRPYAARLLAPEATVFRDGGVVVIDLERAFEGGPDPSAIQ